MTVGVKERKGDRVMKYQFEHNKIIFCRQCPMAMYDDTLYAPEYCGINGRPIMFDEKPNWCPLVEVQDE